MIKAIIFDFDGVIHDTLELGFMINNILQPGLSLDEYKDYFDGNFYEKAQVTTESAQKFFKIQKEHFKTLQIKPEIKKQLLKAKEKYELFIISSNSEGILNMYFENNNILNIFTEVLGVETHKSKVEKFKMVFNKHNLTPDNCIFISDTLGDVLEAHRINVKTIAVDFGFHEHYRLEKGNPLTIISHFNDILKTIEKL